MGVLGAMVGLVGSIALTFFLVISIVKRSNDWGDSSGTLEDFTNGSFTITDKKNDVNKHFRPK